MGNLLKQPELVQTPALGLLSSSVCERNWCFYSKKSDMKSGTIYFNQGKHLVFWNGKKKPNKQQQREKQKLPIGADSSRNKSHKTKYQVVRDELNEALLCSFFPLFFLVNGHECFYTNLILQKPGIHKQHNNFPYCCTTDVGVCFNFLK